MNYRINLTHRIIAHIVADDRFKLIKINPLLIMGWDTDNVFLDLKKPLGRKGLAQVRLTLISEDPEYGVEFKIEVYLNSYCYWETMFEGWLESTSDLETVFKMLGINE